MKSVFRLALAAGIAVSSMGIAEAATATGNLNVSLTVAAGCTVATGALSFPRLTAITGPVTQSTTINVTCSVNTPYTVALGMGSNAQGGQRNLANGASTIPYGLFRDPSFSAPWGNTVGTDTVSMTGSGVAQALTVYGRIPGAPSGALLTGNYTDQVVITVDY